MVLIIDLVALGNAAWKLGLMAGPRKKERNRPIKFRPVCKKIAIKQSFLVIFPRISHTIDPLTHIAVANLDVFIVMLDLHILIWGYHPD